MKNVTYKTFSYQIPFEIVCTVSGVKKVYTSEEYINGKIDRFGGLDQLRAQYVSRDAKKAAKAAGAPIKEIKLEIKEGDKPEKTLAEITVFKAEAPVPLTKANAGDVCHNPSFLLDGKPCSKCAFVGICTYKDSPKGKLLQAKQAKKNSKAA